MYGKTLKSFLNDYKITTSKDNQNIITHTRIPDTNLKIHGGSYSIPEDQLPIFYSLIYDHVFTNGNKEYLTETQLRENNGEDRPLVIDFDFNYDINTPLNRIHNDDLIMSINCLILDKMKIIFDFSSNTTTFPLYVFQRTKPYICDKKKEALSAIKEIFDGKFGLAKEILIEEFLNGEEMSFFIISDGKTYLPFGTAQDHKRVLEGDKGKNTGGMGAYSPSRLENENLNNKIINKIINPTLSGLRDLNSDFKGFLYAGLMIVNNEPFLIEYNVRMGDPECQTILPKLKTDFIKLITACVNKNLNSINLEWYDDKSLCIVLCSKGYPEIYKNNIEIKNLIDIKLNQNEFIFHAGTKKEKDKILSNGGRVLNFVIRSDSFKNNRQKAINLINQINWKNGFFRKDIGYKVID